MAATPGSLAQWRRRRGEQSYLPQAEVVLITSLAQNSAGFSLLLHNNSLLQTVIVHAVLGGCGPRWQPLNETDCHALLARRQLESVLAGGNDDGGIKCDRTTRRSSIGWEAAGGGNGGADQFRWQGSLNFFIFRVLIWLVFVVYIRPFCVIIRQLNRPFSYFILTRNSRPVNSAYFYSKCSVCCVSFLSSCVALVFITHCPF